MTELGKTLQAVYSSSLYLTTTWCTLTNTCSSSWPVGQAAVRKLSDPHWKTHRCRGSPLMLQLLWKATVEKLHLPWVYRTWKVVMTNGAASNRVLTNSVLVMLLKIFVWTLIPIFILFLQRSLRKPSNLSLFDCSVPLSWAGFAALQSSRGFTEGSRSCSL